MKPLALIENRCRPCPSVDGLSQEAYRRQKRLDLMADIQDIAFRYDGSEEDFEGTLRKIEEKVRKGRGR